MLDNGLPETLPNGWEHEERLDENVKSLINSLNQEFPDANIEGASYGDPYGNPGALILMVGDEQISASIAFAVFGTPKRVEAASTYTKCAMGKDGAKACVTETDPTVMAYYFGGDGFDIKELGEFAAEYQADL